MTEALEDKDTNLCTSSLPRCEYCRRFMPKGVSNRKKRFCGSTCRKSANREKFKRDKGLSDCTNLPKTVSSPSQTLLPLVPESPKNSSFRGKFDPTKFVANVRGFEAYQSSLKPKRYSSLPTGGGDRRSIERYTSRILAGMAFVAYNTPAYLASMMTLGYPLDFPVDGLMVKHHLNRFLEWYRYHYPGELYFWWLEFQRRGAPHVHLCSTVDFSLFPESELRIYTRRNGDKWLTREQDFKGMQAFWETLGGGSASAWEQIRDPMGARKYIAKYATKTYQKQVPEGFQNVGRFWNCSQKGVRPKPMGYYLCTEEQLRLALERGGWEYIPDDMIYSELFQAASKIDLSGLASVSEIDFNAAAEFETGKLILRDDQNVVSKKEISWGCSSCKILHLRWVGRCLYCESWDTIMSL